MAGVGIGELIRRRSRVESYAQAVFERRLNAHEKLLVAVRTASRAANTAFEAPESERDEANYQVFTAGLAVAEIADEFEMYIDELGSHCVALWLDVPDIIYSTDSEQREAQIKAFRLEINRTIDMIRDLSGLTKGNQIFQSVTGSRIDSPVVDRVRELRDRYDRR